MITVSDGTDYGALAGTVAAAGSLFSAITALTVSWKGRTRWDPVEEDLPRGPRKMAGLLTAVVIAAIWYWLRGPDAAAIVTLLAIGLGGCCLLAMIAYGFAISVLTYEREVSRVRNEVTTERVVGGLWLDPNAKRILKRLQQDRVVTPQELFKGSGYDVDKLWTRPSRALAKALLMVLFVGTISTGTIATTCAAILFGEQLEQPREPAEQDAPEPDSE